MLDVRRFVLYALPCYIVLLPSYAAARPPTLLATPTLTGGIPTDLIQGIPVTLPGNDFVIDPANLMGGVFLEAGNHGVTFEHLSITSIDAPAFAIIPELGATSGGMFTQPWVVTPTANGYDLDWQPGAAKLGQLVGTSYYGLELDLDPTLNAGVDLTAFDKATFQIEAVPEPGLMALGSGLLVGGGLLLCHAAQRKRTRTVKKETMKWQG